MQKIKPAEVSALLKKQLESADIQSSFDEIGTVLEVGDGIARVYGLSNAQYGELVSFDNGLQGMVLNLEEDHVGIVLFGTSKGVKEGDSVKRTNQIASIKVGEGILGRVVDTLENQLMERVQLRESFLICQLREKHQVLFIVNQLMSHCKQELNQLMQ